MKAKDLTGQTFGRLTVIKRVANTPHGKACWACRCSCGRITNITARHLISGTSHSCGCLRSELKTLMFFKHGKRDTQAYKIWGGMRNRCNNPKNKDYIKYGGRGIKVCERWNDFQKFYTDMGDPPPDTSINRKNNDGDYEPDNCEWATIIGQNNNRRSNVPITYQGKTQTLSQWAKEYGINYHLLWGRINKRHWPIEKALTTPP